LGRRLKILGKGPELKKLKKIADPKWVEFVESPSDAQVDEYYSRARGLLFPGVEDFGIVPVEASACGLPVIGFRSGGLLDSQTSETCEFYDEQTVDGLAAAIEKFEKRTFDEQILRKNSERFSEEEFIRKVKTSILAFSERQGLQLDL
jgi:glycosyltransferase involved in cell wall biosynthesis